MSLQILPTEIIELVAEQVHQLSTLNALCSTNRRFHLILNWLLYQRDAQRPCKALLWGAYTGNLKVMQRSLDYGANIHAKNIQDKTPLLKAVEGQNLEAINFLLDRGADINYSNSFADSIMYVAVFTRNVDVVKLALERGADPDALSYANTRPLSLAVARNDIAIAEALVKCKARMDEPGPGYYTPLITAVHEARYDILKMFIKNGVFSTDKDGSLGAEALRRAVLNRDYEALDILLKAGADPSKNGWHGRCTIMEASWLETEDLAISLSERVVNLKELRDKDDEGLLYYAVGSRCKRFTKYLLDRGLSLDDTHEPELREVYETLFPDNSHASQL
ncbi:hypothetical protein NW768_007396 [Fusarium equiseti]|uniref:Ankyrin n=1 Tax=Fusarium equiseti TaxID=61235 RepID=A0ABQ8R7C8_FUSEQ|nr:hypothetical protein NW768_007396 [Fusarium equiseti]